MLIWEIFWQIFSDLVGQEDQETAAMMAMYAKASKTAIPVNDSDQMQISIWMYRHSLIFEIP